MNTRTPDGYGNCEKDDDPDIQHIQDRGIAGLNRPSSVVRNIKLDELSSPVVEEIMLDPQSTWAAED